MRAIRALGLLEIAEESRYLYIRSKNAARNRRFRKSFPNIALPPARLLYETSSGVDYQAYFEGGRYAAELIWRYVPEHLRAQTRVICEWGCGNSRVIRHMPTMAGASFTRMIGTDYDERMIRWSSSSLPGIEFKKNDVRPPLPLDDSSVDCLYAVSVLTHLDEELQREWIAEIFRVLRPGGIMILTTHSEGTKELLSDEERRRYDRDEMVIRSARRMGGRLFASYASPGVMRRLFQAGTILEHFPAGIGNQDVWVVQRRP